MKTRMVTPEFVPDAATRCSVMDWILRRLAPRVAFCYPVRLDPERLAKSLARVLTDFPEFAGRLVQSNGELWIHAGGDGVPFEVACSGGSLHTLLAEANASHGEQVTPDLALGRALAGKAPLFAARLTQTSDGSILGITWHHPVGDFHSAMLLLRAWARAYHDQSYDPPVSVPDRDAYLSEHLQDSPGATSQLYIASFADCMRLAMAASISTRRVILTFSRAELAAMQAAAKGEQAVTMDDALWAQIVMAVRRLRALEAPSQVLLTINLRWQLKLPLTLLGNMMSYVTETALPSDDVATLAARLRTKTQQFSARDVNHHATMDFVRAHRGRLQRELYMPVGLNPHAGNMIISPIVNFSYNDLKFEQTAPIGLFGIPNDRPLFHGTAIQPPGHGARATGREVSLWLPQKLAQRLSSPEGRALLLSAPERTPELEPSPSAAAS